jgi:hypothetical protein
MDTSSWFENLPVVGQLPPEQAAGKLREVGEEEVAEQLEQSEGETARAFGPGEKKGLSWWPFQDKPWQYTAHTFGYLGPVASGSGPQPVRSVEDVKVDPNNNLRGARIKLTLNRLRIASYPGGGMHRVLLHCYVQNQTPGKAQPLHFNATYRAHEGESAGVQGYPLFVGLSVGQEGITLKCRTINVRNDQDEAFLSFLESDTFKAGLHLVSTAQPVLAPFSEMAYSIAKMVAARNRNVSVQDFDLGLDFSTTPMQGRLAEGAYLAVQIPESFSAIWDWDDWVYLPTKGLVVKRDNQQELIPYNYLVFGVSRYDERGHI